MQGSDCAGVLVLAPARQGIPCWTYVEEEEERRNPPVHCNAAGSSAEFSLCSVQCKLSELSKLHTGIGCFMIVTISYLQSCTWMAISHLKCVVYCV